MRMITKLLDEDTLVTALTETIDEVFDGKGIEYNVDADTDTDGYPQKMFIDDKYFLDKDVDSMLSVLKTKIMEAAEIGAEEAEEEWLNENGPFEDFQGWKTGE